MRDGYRACCQHHAAFRFSRCCWRRGGGYKPPASSLLHLGFAGRNIQTDGWLNTCQTDTPRDMNINPCPHCCRRVIPMADGTCPACAKNTSDRSGTDPSKVLVGIRSGQRLPDVCHRCGTPTRTTQRLTVASEPRGTTFVDGFSQLVATSSNRSGSSTRWNDIKRRWRFL
jgi:hypothetical protein